MQGISAALDLALQYGHQYSNFLVATDSLSSMQALHNRPKHNFNIHYEILLKLKMLTMQGKDITFLHVPSHVGIRGNNLADIAARNAAEYHSTNSQLKHSSTFRYTRNEAKALLWIACKTNFDHFPSLLHYPEQRGIYPEMPSNLLMILRRIRTSSCIFDIQNPNFQKECDCGKVFNLYHLQEGCLYLFHHFNILYQYLKSKELSLLECTCLHEDYGWEPALILTKDIYFSPFAYLF